MSGGNRSPDTWQVVRTMECLLNTFRLALIASAFTGVFEAGALAQNPHVSPKKGIGMVAGRDPMWFELVDSINVGWQYGWGFGPPEKNPPDNAIWVPMKWGGGPISSETRRYLTRGRFMGVIDSLLGFNEPDSVNQANMPVSLALAQWPELESFDLPLGSPGTVNPTNAWMVEFMDEVELRGLRVDFVCVHWYGGANGDSFINRLNEVYNRYNRPILITEFAPADWNATPTRPNIHSPAQVLAFMQNVLPRMEALDYVLGYAWFPAGQQSLALGTSALHDPNGQLTPLGEYYAGFVGGKWRATTEVEGWSTSNARMLLTARGSGIHCRTVTLAAPPRQQSFWRADGILGSTANVPANHDTWFEHKTATTIALYLDTNHYADGWLPASNRMYQDPPFVARRYNVTGNFLSEMGFTDWAPGVTDLGMTDNGTQQGDVTAGDGIYTTRVTIPLPGNYAFVILAENDWNRRYGHLGATGNLPANNTSFGVAFPNQTVTFHVDITRNTVQAVPRGTDPGPLLDVISGPDQLIQTFDTQSSQDLANQFDMDNDNDLDIQDVAHFAIDVR